MKPRELSVTVSQKVNLGNYETKGYGYTITVDLLETDDLLSVKQQLTNKLNQMLEFEVKKTKNGGGQP